LITDDYLRVPRDKRVAVGSNGSVHIVKKINLDERPTVNVGLRDGLGVTLLLWAGTRHVVREGGTRTERL